MARDYIIIYSWGKMVNCNRREDCRVVKYLQFFGTTTNQAQGSLTHFESPYLASGVQTGKSQLSFIKLIVYTYKEELVAVLVEFDRTSQSSE